MLAPLGVGFMVVWIKVFGDTSNWQSGKSHTFLFVVSQKEKCEKFVWKILKQLCL